jgi:hypothetical protein
MIVWREKFVAMGVHFVATAVLAGIAAALIFLVWFPTPFQSMVGGTELFLLVVGCDLALGPLLSLVIYNSRKSRRQLVMDYTVVGAVQIAALVYGVLIVADVRPAYVAYFTDRFEIVLAGDIREAELAAAKDPAHAKVGWGGPRFVGVTVPPEAQQEALFESVAGNEEHQRPRFYVPFEEVAERIRKRGKPLADLEKKKPQSKPLLDEALAKVDLPRDSLLWVPARSFRSIWTAVVDPATGKPVAWIDVDPYD